MTASRKKAKRILPMTRAAVLLPPLKVARSLGVPIDHHLKRAHIPPSVLEDPMRMIPRSFVGKLADSIAEGEGIEDFGILVGSQINALRDIPVFGIHLQHSRTCRDYINEAARLIGLIAPGRKVRLRRDGRRWRLNFEVSGPLKYFSQHQELYTLAATIRTISDMLGREWRPNTIWLPPGYRLGPWAMDWLQEPNIKPTKDLVAFSIPNSVLRARNVLRPQSRAPGSVVVPKPPLLKSGIKSVVQLLIADPALSLKIVAEAAGMPGRTLQHILARDGTSFREVQSAARLQIAKQLLRKSDMPVSEVASRLGYTNSENFTRAFRKLTRVSPSSYRQRRNR
jgi:AraC-like DNA-binding protein